MSAALPPAAYAEPESFAAERRTVFGAAWLMLGRVAPLTRAGDYLALGLGGWPILAVRDGEGHIAAFRNQCRHQGLPVVDSGAGHRQALRCPYHGWTYGLDGSFVAAPPVTAPADPGAPMHHLAKVPAEAWEGLLFVHPGPKPPAPLAAALAQAPAPGPLAFRTEIATDINANWKVVVERYLAAEHEGRHWIWPSAIVDRSEEGAVVHQIIARAFERTRVIRHCYGREFADERAAAAADKRACEERQATLGTGSDLDLPATPALAAFRARLGST